jgi:hypothetical protein
MEHIYKNIEGWFTFPVLYSTFAREYPSGSHFVEVGSWLGQSAAYMAVELINNNKKIRFDCVDTWVGSDEHKDMDIIKEDALYNTFLKNIESVKDYINPVRKSSLEAALDYQDESLDFVFIDAAHDYENVKKDIHAWYPKVKNGGFISGHDYSGAWPEVIVAVNEFSNYIRKGIELGEGCWAMRKV